MFLPKESLIKKELHVSELTQLQIRMLTWIEHLRLKMIWGGEKENG